MQERKASFKDGLEYALFAGLVFLIKHSPLFALNLERKALIFFLKKGSPRHSRLISHNLALAFPDADPARREELKKGIYSHFGSIFVEIARAYARKNPQAILARSRIHHVEYLEQALAKKQGVIIFSAHFGNWEWIPLLLRDRLGKDVYSIARPIDNPRVERKIMAFREGMGSRVIYKQGSIRTILKLLAGNEIVFLLIDQNTVPREGIFVDFFGRKASAITTVSQLHLKKGIPVVPVFLHYEGEAIVLDVFPEASTPLRRDEPASLAELTQQLTRMIEAQVRRFPEQWFWFHDRWKTRPQGDES